MEKISPLEREGNGVEVSSSRGLEHSVEPSLERGKRIQLAVMVGAGILAGMMLSFALCGSPFNTGGMLGGGLTGLLIHYLS